MAVPNRQDGGKMKLINTKEQAFYLVFECAIVTSNSYI